MADSNNLINGHEYVDLGLSVKWATCNIGATSPSDYGKHFAWGETSPKSEYTEENSVTFHKEIGCIAGNPQNDAATANWGGSWRLPTRHEMFELSEKCKREWTTEDGHKGYRLTGPNGNSIFLPAAGWCFEKSLRDANKYGLYWSDIDITYGERTHLADNLSFRYGFVQTDEDSRHRGMSIRPVSD